MKLFEHEDFDQAIVRAREHFGREGLTEQFIEKDYYVTEALRIIAAGWPDEAVFKGGTSLSKGWGLIHRFSEDLDLFVNPAAPDPPITSSRGKERLLKGIRDGIGAHPGLEWLEGESRALPGPGRKDYYRCARRFPDLPAVADRVLLESGVGSGDHPTERVEITSCVARFLRETGATLGAADEAPFPMLLLHFRRTFVEKMFTLHARVERCLKDGSRLGSYARHYYDLYQLAQRAEVIEMLRGEEYSAIKEDYDRVSRAFYGQRYLPPEGMTFKESVALFPTGDLREALRGDYDEQCRNLCYGPYPRWEEVEGCFEGLRGLL